MKGMNKLASHCSDIVKGEPLSMISTPTQSFKVGQSWSLKPLKEAIIGHPGSKMKHPSLTLPQTYVQDLLVEVGEQVYRQVVMEKGHFYVCGDCTMAECVYQKLKAIVQEHGRLSDQEVENFMLQMRVRHDMYVVWGLVLHFMCGIVLKHVKDFDIIAAFTRCDEIVYRWKLIAILQIIISFTVVD